MRPAVREKKKSICDSEILSETLSHRLSLCGSTKDTLGLYRGLNQSEIVKGGPPPSDWPWSRCSCTCVYVWKCMCCCSQTEREVSNRDVRSVANLATFQTPLATFFFKATSDKSSKVLDKL